MQQYVTAYMEDVEEVCPTCGKRYEMAQQVVYKNQTEKGTQMQFVHGPREIHEEPIERIPERMRE